MSSFLAVILFTLASLLSSTLAGDVSSLISPSMFNEMLKHRNDGNCPGKGFYTYNAFINAARSFDAFGTTGDINTRKRELVAFFAQTSHQTTGGRKGTPDGPFTWGYCFVKEQGDSDEDGYYGRGPMLLKHRYNYEQAGRAIGANLESNPDLVVTDPTISFKTAIWFWMTPHPKTKRPSSHDVITGIWSPSAEDLSAGRQPGYGVITNIINGKLECGKGSPDSRVLDRIGFYMRYCNLFGLRYGTNLGCKDQKPFD
ncbi:hypothetical protein LguiA_005637 [Lonicera macranthoides]